MKLSKMFLVMLVGLYFLFPVRVGAIEINNNDLPLWVCSSSHPIDSYYANDIDWSYEKWGSLSAIAWSPSVAGIKSVGTDKIILRFYFTNDDIDFFKNAKFFETNTRKPFALEIDIVDSDEVFGTLGDEWDYFGLVHTIPDIPVYYDEQASDNVHQLSVFIPRPDLLEPNKVHEIVFYPKNRTQKSGNIHFNFQLSVNYKYLAVLRNGQSESCDVLDLIGDVRDMSVSDINYLISGNYENNIPENTINGWYYFQSARNDASHELSVGPGKSDVMCWNDQMDSSNHNDSNADLCNNRHAINLFDVKVGDDFYSVGQPSEQSSLSLNANDFDTPPISSSPTPEPASAPDPASLPNLQIEEFNVHDTPDHKLPDDGTGLMIPGQTYEVHVWPVSKEDGCLNGIEDGKDMVETDTFYKIAMSEDEGEWIFLHRNYTQCINMDKDDSKKEIFDFTVPEESRGKRIYFKSKVDATGEVRETDEHDNWSDVEWYPVAGDCDLEIASARLTGNRTSLTQWDKFGFALTLENSGTDDCPIDTRSAYYYRKPGESELRYVTSDGTPASKLLSGQQNEEWMTEDTLVADKIGTHEIVICADYLNPNSESDETNNCKTFSFTVNPPPPPEISVISPKSGDKWRCDDDGDYKYIKWTNKNFPSAGTVSLYYTLDGGSSWRTITSSTANDGSYKWHMCQNKIKDVYGYVKVVSSTYKVSGISQKFYMDHARGCE